MRYWLVVPAAGTGSRFGAPLPKQFQLLGARTVLEWSLRHFLNDQRCRRIVLAGDARDQRLQALCGQHAARLAVVDGGARRCDSVLRGLRALGDDCAAGDWVLVHDAARPCLSAADLERLLQAGADSGSGALLAEPIRDTVKLATATTGAMLEVGETLPRERLWRAQTPQMFRYGELLPALESALATGREPTDEAQALEWQGRRALLVAALDPNPKLTTLQDLEWIAAILARAAP